MREVAALIKPRSTIVTSSPLARRSTRAMHKLGGIMSSQTVGGYPLAGLGERLVSAIIDTIIQAVLGFLVGFVLGLVLGSSASSISSLVAFIVAVGYYVYYWSAKDGQTPGKSMLGLRVIKTDGSPIAVGTAILRYIGYIINTVIILMGWIWIIFDAQHQGWHDKLAGTVVVKVK